MSIKELEYRTGVHYRTRTCRYVCSYFVCMYVHAGKLCSQFYNLTTVQISPWEYPKIFFLNFFQVTVFP